MTPNGLCLAFAVIGTLLCCASFNPASADGNGNGKKGPTCPSAIGSSLEGYINAGNSLFGSGKFKKAAACYELALRIDKKSPLALTNSGLAFMNVGKTDRALKRFKAALKAKPDYAEAYHAMGSLFYNQNDFPRAAEAMRHATIANPNHGEAYNHLANVYATQQDGPRALETYRKAVQLLPQRSDIRASMARILVALGHVKEGLQHFQTAAKTDPNNAMILQEYGSSLKSIRKFDEAEKVLQQALKLDPTLPTVHYTLGEIYAGDIYTENKRIPQAIDAHTRATELNPQYAESYMSLAMLYWGQGRLQLAEDLLKHSLSSRPLAEAAANLGIVQSDMGKYEDALVTFQQAQRLNPSLPEAYKCLGDTYKHLNKWPEAIQQYKKALSKRPEYHEALNDLVHALQHTCEWEAWRSTFHEVEAVLASELKAGRFPLFVKPFHALVYPLEPEHMLLVARSYANRAIRLTKSFLRQPMPTPTSLRQNGMIRLGYVSSNIGDHSLSHLMQNVFKMHGKQFEVFMFALNPSDGSNYRAKIERDSGNRFVRCDQLSGVDCAKEVNKRQIHSLVDLVGYTGGGEKANEVFAVKPAAHQWSYMGFCASSGASYMDHIVADRIAATPEMQGHFSEKITLVPYSYFVTDHTQSFQAVPVEKPKETRLSVGIPQDALVLACFNQLYKIDPSTFEVWMRILKQHSQAVLWLLRFPPEAMANILKEAKAMGVDSNRLIFSDPVPKEQYMQRAKLADVFLDTPLVNAHTSATDVMWAGVPIVTLPGRAMIARVAASLVEAARVPELVVRDLKDYEALVARLLHGQFSRGRRLALRQRVEQSRTEAIFDTQGWTRRLDIALKATWDVTVSAADNMHIVATRS